MMNNNEWVGLYKLVCNANVINFSLVFQDAKLCYNDYNVRLNSFVIKFRIIDYSASINKKS